VKELVDDRKFFLVSGLTIKVATRCCVTWFLRCRCRVLSAAFLELLVGGVCAVSASATAAASAAATVVAPAALTSPATTTSAPATLHRRTVLILVLMREVVAKVDSFVVEKLFLLLRLVLPTASLLGSRTTIVIVCGTEAQKRVRIDLGLVDFFGVHDIKMRLELVLSLERHIALLLAAVVWAHEVRA